MNAKLESVLSVLLTLSAVVVASIAVYRQLTPLPLPDRIGGSPERAERFASIADSDLQIGSANPVLTLVEFGDFQCPYCKIFHRELESFMAANEGKVALIWRHLPLSIHPHARAAGTALECAARQGKTGVMAAQLFESQDSLGRIAWTELASRVRVANSTSFLACMRDSSVLARVRRDEALASELGIQATPTVFPNGWKLPHAPRSDSLRAMLRRAEGGRAIF